MITKPILPFPPMVPFGLPNVAGRLNPSPPNSPLETSGMCGCLATCTSLAGELPTILKYVITEQIYAYTHAILRKPRI